MPYPDVVIPGAMRSGTSSLWIALLEQPRINVGAYLADGSYKAFKEFMWFSHIDRHEPFETYKRWFTSHEHHINCLNLDASPDYFHTPGVPERLAAVNPDVRIVMLLRNPINRLWSHYWHEKNHTGDATGSFQDELNRRPRTDVKLDHQYYYAHAYLEIGHYAEHLERWFANFPRTQFHVIRSEDLFADFTGQLNEILDFLELPRTDYQPDKIQLKGTYDPLPADWRSDLETYYRPHNEALSSLVGINWEEKEEKHGSRTGKSEKPIGNTLRSVA
jgi:hypothetical protein